MAFLLRPFAILGLTALFISHASAQTAPAQPVAVADLIRVNDVKAEAIRSPQYDASVRATSTNRDGRRDWLQVKAEFATAPTWLDEITFTFYVALQGKAEDLPEGAKPTNVFRGTVSWIHVPKARDHVVDMFLDPNTFARFGSVFAVAVVVEINGQPAALVTQPESLSARRWWETETANAIPLVSRYDSPYRLIEIDSQGTLQP